VGGVTQAQRGVSIEGFVLSRTGAVAPETSREMMKRCNGGLKSNPIGVVFLGMQRMKWECLKPYYGFVELRDIFDIPFLFGSTF
jgi:hypothetical protein